MNILYVCHRFPYPPNRGGKIRPFNMISHLQQSHEVTVASLARTDEEAEAGSGIAPHCRDYMVETISEPVAVGRMVARLPTPEPSSMGYFWSPRLARRIGERLAAEKFDFIFVHCSSVAQYVENVTGIPKMLDFGDMDSQKWLTYAKVRGWPLRWGYALEGHKLERAEKALARKFDFCSATTRAEYETLESYSTGTPADWFPNGVDLDFFAPSNEPYQPGTICFIGRMDYYPNQQAMLDFCANALPLIRARRPDATLAIVGAKPSREIRALGEIEGVTVTGTVPDVRPYVTRSAVNVAPLSIARGTQNKILESMAMGVPVVSSVEAGKGIDAVAGEHFLAAATPGEFADAVVRLLDDDGERQRLARAGRARVEERHYWPNSMKKLDTLIDRCLEAAGGKGRSAA